MLLSKCRLSNNRLDNFLLSKQTLGNFYLDGPVYGGSIDAYTKSLLHFNGTDGSTTFTDETGKIWTRYGNAQIDTAQKKFGFSSGLFDGSGDYIDTPDSEDFNVGSGDFTIDCWIKRAETGVRHYIFGQCNSTQTVSTRSVLIYIDSPDYLKVWFGNGSSLITITSNGTINTNWHHVAVVRNGDVATIYIDGVADVSVSMSGVTINNSSNKVAIGRPGEYNSNYFNGWIDEFRFSKGIARWTSNFTPPTQEYTV